MNFTEAVQAVFKKYAVFDGRSRRSEYWYWVLFGVLVSIVLSILDSAIFGSHYSSSGSGFHSNGPLQSIYGLATLVPSLAVAIRRLHDVNKSGWWFLIAFTIVGIIPLLYWYCQEGTAGKNDYGAPAPTKP